MRVHALVAALLLMITGLATPPAVSRGDWSALRQAQVNPTPSIFTPFYDGVIPNDRLDAIRTALPYDRVALQRAGGVVIGAPVFALTLSKSGEATLAASNAFGRTGTFVGRVDLFSFGKLSHLISQSGFDRLDSRYAARLSDLQTSTLTITTGAKAQSVVDYGGAGPVELWALEKAIMAIGHEIHWSGK